MVKLTKYILLACIVLTQQACVKDLQDDINDGGWNHERTILDIQFENQMGTALIETVDAATGDINLAINVDAVPDLSNIRLKKATTLLSGGSFLRGRRCLEFREWFEECVNHCYFRYRRNT